MNRPPEKAALIRAQDASKANTALQFVANSVCSGCGVPFGAEHLLECPHLHRYVMAALEPTPAEMEAAKVDQAAREDEWRKTRAPIAEWDDDRSARKTIDWAWIAEGACWGVILCGGVAALVFLLAVAFGWM